MKTTLSNPSFTGSLGGRNLKEGWLLMLAAWVATIHVSAVEVKAQGPSCYVHTVSGDLQGSDLGDSCAFLGVPFAASTENSNRWKPPQPAAPWALINATTPPASCPQVVLPAGLLQGNEDCLRLNIWVSDPPPKAQHPSSCGCTRARSSALRPTLLPTRARGWPRKPERSSWRPTTVGSLRLPGPQRARGGGSRLSLLWQLRPAGPTGRPQMGSRQHRPVRRGPGQRDHRRHVSRG